MNRSLCLIPGVALVLGVASCGGGGSGGTVGPPPPPATCTTANTFCMATQTYFPNNLSVAAGTTVNWQNDTNSLHNVVWDTPAGRNAAGLGDGTGDIAQFSSGVHSRKFVTAGTYPFHCSIHPSTMTGTLTVTP
jgi:plastocyanin